MTLALEQRDVVDLVVPGDHVDQWHWTRRLGFMFVFVFVLLLVLPFPFGVFGIPGRVGDWWEALWTPIVPWVAQHLLHLDYQFPRYGGGETWEFIQVGTAAVISTIVALIWASIDRGRADLRRLDRWFRVYLRLFLATVLFAYGWPKVLPVQFPALGPERLSESFGEASPSGLLWAFMGYSKGYMAFGGAGEIVAGLLLCFRRTTTLGALIGMAVMSNVVALNYAFDVGVKIESTFYLLALAYLAAPDAKRLADVLVLGHPPQPARPSFPLTRWQHRLTVVAPAVLAAYFFATNARGAWRSAHEWGRFAPRPPLYGLYDVESVERGGVTRSLVPQDSALWSRVAIGQLRSTIRLASGTVGFYVAAVDTVAHSIRFKSRDDSSTFVLAYERPDTNHLVLRGHLGQDSLSLSLRRRDESAYRLVSHRFDWAHNTSANR